MSTRGCEKTRGYLKEKGFFALGGLSSDVQPKAQFPSGGKQCSWTWQTSAKSNLPTDSGPTLLTVGATRWILSDRLLLLDL